MSSKSSGSGSGGGIGLGGAVFIVFLVLKLTGNIDWSWWWVTAPLWIPLSVFLCIALVVGVAFVFLTVLDKLQRRGAR